MDTLIMDNNINRKMFFLQTDIDRKKAVSTISRLNLTFSDLSGNPLPRIPDSLENIYLVNENQLYPIHSFERENDLVEFFSIQEELPVIRLSDCQQELDLQENSDLSFVSEENETNLRFLSKERKTEPVCYTACKANPDNITYVPYDKQSPRIIKEVLKKRPTYWISIDSERRSYEHLLSQFEYDTTLLAFFPKFLITPQICKEAVEGNGWALPYIPNKYKSPAICRTALETAAEIHPDISGLLRHIHYPEICLEGYRLSKAYEFFDARIVFNRVNKKGISQALIREALQDDPDIYHDLPKKFKTIKNASYATKQNPYFITGGKPMGPILEELNQNSVIEAHIFKWGTEHIKTQIDDYTFSPELYTFQAIHRPEQNMRIPAEIKNKQNIYTFFKRFHKQYDVRPPVTFKQIDDLYKGKKVNFDSVQDKNSQRIYLHRKLSYNKEKAQYCIEGNIPKKKIRPHTKKIHNKTGKKIR